MTMGDKTLSHKFQSTLPRGERRYSPGTVHRQWHYFNPRSHEGSDVQKLVDKLSDITDFNPRSHEGSDCCLLRRCTGLLDFNPRSHEGSDEDQHEWFGYAQKFQSTLPRGERRHEVQQQTQVRDFNPRSHEGSDCGKGLQRSTTLLFQSTLPRGERLPIPQRQSERILFQSTLPRGERRSRSVYSLCHYAISIHAPTRGATMPT